MVSGSRSDLVVATANSLAKFLECMLNIVPIQARQFVLEAGMLLSTGQASICPRGSCGLELILWDSLDPAFSPFAMLVL